MTYTIGFLLTLIVLIACAISIHKRNSEVFEDIEIFIIMGIVCVAMMWFIAIPLAMVSCALLIIFSKFQRWFA